jgi:hypothetical protein
MRPARDVWRVRLSERVDDHNVRRIGSEELARNFGASTRRPAGHSDLQKFDFNVSVTVATLICHRIGLLTVFLFALVLTACGAPVKVERVNLRTAYEDLNRTAFSTDQPSGPLVPSCAVRPCSIPLTLSPMPPSSRCELRLSPPACTGPTPMRWRR